ncbi:uncharacterized protein LOC107266644 isoform X2 [Cephus cinctus]|uniref:Uncharacterized protein LOC107266644 isoform X2 n=1 Tax=Cephus cinctus TaxID=211228 RepID=A0AAJ7BRY8_CEPCN|nr:uncharacterized protein LOC107266644 isoform X2 [Cephus cinctus]
MAYSTFLYDILGKVSQIVGPDKAEIQFVLHENVETALLKKDRFYHNGRRLTENEPFEKYIKCGLQVKFSCHIFDSTPKNAYGWYVTICWRHKTESETQIQMCTGMTNVLGEVTKLKKRHGTLTMEDNAGRERKVHFLASKFYVRGKRFPGSKVLSSELSLDDKVFFDAIPCMPEENEENCEWFATCVFKGQRPQCKDDEKLNDNILGNLVPQTSSDRIMKSGACLAEIVKLYINDPRNVFVSGAGVVLDIFNDDYGIILGEFQRNLCETIVFHRRNAFLFKMSLAHSKLGETFMEGYRKRSTQVYRSKSSNKFHYRLDRNSSFCFLPGKYE